MTFRSGHPRVLGDVRFTPRLTGDGEMPTGVTQQSRTHTGKQATSSRIT
jgi:hypothetical protein